MKTLSVLALTACAAASMARAQMVLEGQIVQEGGLDAPAVEQDPLPGAPVNVTYVATSRTNGSPDSCTFNEGAFADDASSGDGIPGNSWFVRSNNPTMSPSAGKLVEGCLEFDQSSNTASRRLPRAGSKIRNPSGPGWCFNGAVNGGGSSNANAGKANYNGLSGGNSNYNSWAYCTEQLSKTVRYTVVKSFSPTAGFDGPGAPCAKEWNFNNNTNGAGGIKVGVLQSCLPFDTYQPRTEGLDFSDVPEDQRRYWCHINTGEDSQGYNPVKMDGGSLDVKTLDWGFCQDANAVQPTSAPSPSASPSMSPSATPSASPLGEGETAAPTATVTDAPSVSGTAAPSQSGGQSGGSDTAAPSSGIRVGSAALLAALASLAALL